MSIFYVNNNQVSKYLNEQHFRIFGMYFNLIFNSVKQIKYEKESF